jgi:hypothetical protein
VPQLATLSIAAANQTERAQELEMVIEKIPCEQEPRRASRRLSRQLLEREFSVGSFRRLRTRLALALTGESRAPRVDERR